MCEAARCVQIDSASVEARGAVEGAPPGVRVEQQVVGSEVCEERGTKLVCRLERGSKVVLVAPEVEGHRFTGWAGPKACVGSQRVLELSDVVENTECVARYVRRLRVSGSVDGEAGALVVASAEGEFASCDQSSCVVDRGTRVTLTAPQRDGFRLGAFEGEGCDPAEGYRTTVTPLDNDVTCSATYIESLTVRGELQGVDAADAEATGARIVASSPAPSALCEAELCAIDPGESVVLLAPEIAGYRFRGWIGDERCSGGAAELTLSDVRTNFVCSADYVRRYTARAKSEGAMAVLSASSEGGFATCDGAACEVDQGSTVTFIASTVRGYRLRDWTGEGCSGGSGSSALARDVHRDVACTARFVEGVAVSGTVVNAQATVVAASSSPGASCADGRCAIDVGGTVTLTAPALDARTFRGWSGDPECTGTSRTLTLSDVSESKDCLATFAPRHQAQGRAAPATGGSVVASSSAGNARCNGALCEVDEGGAVVLTATANANFRFTGWSGGGACSGSSPRLELRDLRASIICNANFVGRIVVSAAVAPAAAGSVAATSLSPGAQCSGASCTVDTGADVMLRASAADGYRFTRWSGCGNALALANNPLLLVGPTNNERCTANFERLAYTVTATATAGGSVTGTSAGQTCANGRCTVVHGEGASFTASAAAGYNFSGWSGCVTSSERTIELANVTGDATCRAAFSRIQLTVSAIAGSGGSVSASTGGAQCMNARCSIDYGADVALTATAQAGVEFVNWSGCSTSSERIITLNDVMSSQTCTANFRALEYTVRGAVTAAGGGTVSCATGCTVRHGGSIALTASANTAQGYRFARWVDCTPATNNPLTVANVTADRTCTASFERVPVTVSATAAPVGTGGVRVASAGTTCGAASCTVPSGSRVTISATPIDANHRFLRWSGSGCAGTNPELILPSVSANLACTANFERYRWNVSWEASNTLTPVQLAVSGASCANGRCTKVVERGETVTATLRFNTPTTTGIPVARGWIGCTPTTMNFAAAQVGTTAGFGLTYTYTWSDFSSDASCLARIEPGALGLFAAQVSYMVQESAGVCADLVFTAPGRTRLCASPANTRFDVTHSGTTWGCVINDIPDGTVADPSFGSAPFSISGGENHMVICGGQ
jgi:hypothetical protein